MNDSDSVWEYLHQWRFPLLVPEECPGPPDNIVAACRAVGLDLQCRRHGPDLDLHALEWSASLLESGDCHIGCYGPGLAGVGFGGPHLDHDVATVTMIIAEGVQDNLAGYSFIQWPIEDRRILLPCFRDGRSVWVDPRHDTLVSRIGELCA